MRWTHSILFTTVAIGAGYFAVSRLAVTRDEVESSAQSAPTEQYPDLNFIDAGTGEVWNLRGMQGKVWVADLIFTSCPGPCATMSKRMRALHERFKDDGRVGFLSVTVDPQTDSVEVLRAYGAKHGSDMIGWRFLRTDDHTTLLGLANEYFRVGVGAEPDLHSTRFVVIGSQGQVVGQFPSDEVDFLDKIGAVISQQAENIRQS